MFMLSWQPPYGWPWMLGSLAACTVGDVETVEELSYVRSLSVGEHRSLVYVVPGLHANMLHVTLSTGLQPVASECPTKITRLFDLSRCPRQIITTLGSLGTVHPGLRLPGSIGAFEQGMRAILGQLVNVLMAAKLTVKAAHTYGEALEDTLEYVYFPTPEVLANADPLHLKALGMSLKHVETSIHLAHVTPEGMLATTAPADIEQGVKRLQASPGVGRWTVNYFALYGWQAKDVFLPGDYLVKQRSPGMTPAQIQRYAERRKPWRSYTLLHIWYTDGWQPSVDGEITGAQ